MEIQFAEYIAYWPGQDVVICYAHLQKLISVADTMGFKLSWTKIEDDDIFCTNCANEKLAEKI